MRGGVLLVVVVLPVLTGAVAGGGDLGSPADSDARGQIWPEQRIDDRRSVPDPTAADSVSVTAPAMEAGAQHVERALNVSYTYRRLPAQPNTVKATMRIPPQPINETITIEFDERFDIGRTANVTQADRAYEWDGNQTATFSYQLPLDWSFSNTRTEAWTLFRHPSPTIAPNSTVGSQRQIRVDGPGYVGNKTLVMGAHDVYSGQAAGQTLSVVVPGGVSLLYGPIRTVEALENASESLQIGGRDDIVYAFVSPEIETPLDVPYRGSSPTDNEMLIDADSEMDVWTHEYVHTRSVSYESFVNADGLRWLSEGGAEYYGWLLSIQQGYHGWGDFRNAIGSGIDDNSVLIRSFVTLYRRAETKYW
jgi:hypothetical protein